ncbi:MAG TPA: anaerobic glycerol-3-phosphate dehydrogenase subunit C [Actinomycetota bacterium]|jgi:glycerol-3-phosphate dehydrogenase subunit C|nr:anaerobic glycerol-3-phosphate dehydrogenase subunit C [Actinomycetota bacterium]
MDTMEWVRGSLDHCVKCTICETFCPVSNVTPLFPGPKYVGPQLERFRTDDGSPDASLDYCSGCGICTTVCPQGVKIAEINSQARAKMKAQRGIPLRDRIIARPSAMGKVGTPLAPIANFFLENRAFRWLVERTLRVHRQAPMPLFASRTFQSWARHHAPLAPATKAIVYFHGCSANHFEPHVAQMAVAVLEHNGYRVIVPRQDCCGLPLQSNGLFDDAQRYVRKLARHLEPYARRGYDIVATSTSCGLMLKREAREILELEDDQDLRTVSAHMFDICEFLLNLHERGALRTDFRPLDMRVPYHAPCQQRGHGIGKPALELFRLIPGLEVVDSDVECCGVAGTYGLKTEKYDIAMEVGAPLFRQVTEVATEVAACDSETCRWQITRATGIPSVHPVELLYRAYGLS